MNARLLDGRDLASHLRRELLHRVERISDPETGRAPTLAILRDRSSEPAAVYAASLERAARAIGVATRMFEGADAGELEPALAELNDDGQVAGIVIAQPFADAAAGRRLVEHIDPAKDVDGATPTNAGWLARGEPAFVPATALAVIALLEAAEVEIAGRRAVIVGRSAVVGRPVGAAGVPRLIRPEMVNRSAVIVDCGINAADGRIVGDVDFQHVAPVVRAISPVPGGVGPVTPMMVLRQTVESAEAAAAARQKGSVRNPRPNQPSPPRA